MKQEITLTKGDKTDSIDSLIEFLLEAKEKGATHYTMWWSQDPTWAFKWFETYRIKSEDEIKEEKRKQLQAELEKLK